MPLAPPVASKKIQTFQHFFDDTFVVLCGDALIDLDLSEAVKRHKAKGAMASLITKRVPGTRSAATASWSPMTTAGCVPSKRSPLWKKPPAT